jgi:hypothetical protein
VAWNGAIRLGLLAAAIDFLLAAGLWILLTLITHSGGDAVSRPLGLGVLFAAPGIVGLLGAIGRRRSLLAAAAIPLFAGSFLSWAFVTLPFLVPSLLFARAATRVDAQPLSASARIAGAAAGLVVALLMLAAGVAFLGFTEDTCLNQDGQSSCSSAATTVLGGATAVGLAGLAIAVAAVWASVGRRANLESATAIGHEPDAAGEA